ncbi:hypothetical protein WA026_013578 [Henosepilachna vigintioctopunctata]|uniref:C2H2-type domain-containing protein n=1 Tax=Henosepilachna vigintioctopunctata TaxID=420089 RepID=A0AAW1V6D8_9CUCU
MISSHKEEREHSKLAQVKPGRRLSILHLNVQGIHGKTHVVESFLNDEVSVDIFCATESWLNSVQCSVFSLDGWMTASSSGRNLKSRGGVGIFSRLVGFDAVEGINALSSEVDCEVTAARFSHHVKKNESTISSNEEEKCVPTPMLATIKEGLLQNKSVVFNEKVSNKSGPKLIRLHVDKVDHERRDQCQSCRYVGCSQTILKMHIESIDSYSKNYKCHLCDFVCDLKSKLKDHIGEVHLKLHKFECSLRDSSLDTEKGYKPVLSEGKLKFVCNDCDYKAILKAHVVLHLKSRPHAMKTFKCIYCDFSSIQYWSWKNHMDCVHFEVNSYKCHLCDCGFRMKQRLEKHIDAVHFQKIPYKCGYCNYRALQKGTVQRHIKNAHLLQKNYHCNSCSYSAATNNTLKSHIKSNHLYENYK